MVDYINFRKIRIFIRFHWTAFVIVGVPILLLPLAISEYKEIKCTYILGVVAIFWITEVLSLPVTSLIPFVLFPAFGILKPSEAASCYMKDITMMLIGGLIVAKTIEEQNLHKRLALRILIFMGPDPIFEYLGFMVSSWSLSMWMSNTATVAMMVTLAGAVIEEWTLVTHISFEAKRSSMATQDIAFMEINEMEKCYYSKEGEDRKLQEIDEFSKGLYLSIAYSATCGGIATLTGTPVNLIFYGFMEEKYGSKLGLNFGSFMLFSLPVSIITLLLAWIILCLKYVGIKEIFNREKDERKDDEKMKLMESQYFGLGPLSYGEKSALVVVFILVVLWILREPGVPLWGRLFMFKDKNGVEVKYWTDATSAILASLMVFILPSKNPFKWTNIKEPIPKLLNWKKLESEFSWGLVFLFGGGFALAAGCAKSGLSDIIGNGLTKLSSLPEFWIIFLITLGISFITEMISNTATSTLLIPIMLKMAECIKMHPMKIGLATGIASSFTFSLPAGTPPNAIVFSAGNLNVLDMISSGISLNFLCSTVLAIACCYYSIPIFKTDVFPTWIKSNCTSI